MLLFADILDDFGTAHLVEDAAVAEIRQFNRSFFRTHAAFVHLVNHILNKFRRDHMMAAHGGDGQGVFVRQNALISPYTKGEVDGMGSYSGFVTAGDYLAQQSGYNAGLACIGGLYLF